METNDHNNAMVNHDKNIEVHLLLSPEKLINMKIDGTFYNTILKILNKK